MLNNFIKRSTYKVIRITLPLCFFASFCKKYKNLIKRQKIDCWLIVQYKWNLTATIVLNIKACIYVCLVRMTRLIQLDTPSVTLVLHCTNSHTLHTRTELILNLGDVKLLKCQLILKDPQVIGFMFLLLLFIIIQCAQ